MISLGPAPSQLHLSRTSHVTALGLAIQMTSSQSKVMAVTLYLKPEKHSFDKTSIDYLGVIISKSQIHMDPAKLTSITKWPTPWTLKELQSFLGFCNFYCLFIKDYSMIIHNLFALMKKEIPFHWATPH